jgi:hypothetical protein
LGHVIVKLPSRVIICEDGFVICTLFGAMQRRWEEVKAVHQTYTRGFISRIVGSRGVGWVYRVVIENGPTLRFGRAGLTAHPGDWFQQQVAHVNWPRALADLEEGKWLDFGPIQISRWGVRCGENQLPWAEVEAFEASVFTLRVRRQPGGEWASFRLAEVPNLELLTRLVHHAAQASDSPADLTPSSGPSPGP